MPKDVSDCLAGALLGGAHSIPSQWVSGVREWPTGIPALRRLADAMADGTLMRVRPRWSPGLLIRNLVVLTVVLVHGFARLFRSSR